MIRVRFGPPAERNFPKPDPGNRAVRNYRLERLVDHFDLLLNVMARDTYDHAKTTGLETLEQIADYRHKMVLVEAAVEIHRRIYRPAELFRTLDENAVSFQSIRAERQVPAMPLDATEGDISHRKLPGGRLQLSGPHELHLHLG